MSGTLPLTTFSKDFVIDTSTDFNTVWFVTTTNAGLNAALQAGYWSMPLFYEGSDDESPVTDLFAFLTTYREGRAINLNIPVSRMPTLEGAYRYTLVLNTGGTPYSLLTGVVEFVSS